MSVTLFNKVRIDKSGNKNKDDFRVLMAGIILCIIMIFGQTTYAKLYDVFFAKRPFIVATVSIVHISEGLPPLIKYDADPEQHVNGTWIASVYDQFGTRLNTRRGLGNYQVMEDNPKYWSWSAWFDNEQSDPPNIPTTPFYLCVRYQVEAFDSGITDTTENYCSEVYDPNNPIQSLENIAKSEIIR